MWYVNILRGLLCALVICFLVAAGSFALGATVSFDDFAVPVAPSVSVIGVFDANHTIVSHLNPSAKVGSRDVKFDVSAPPDPVSFVGQVGGDVLVFDSTTPGTVATITYGGLVSPNLNALGNAFQFDFRYVDGNMSQKLGVEIDVIGGGVTATRAFDIDDALAPSTKTVGFPADFPVGWSGDFDVFDNASSIVVRFNPNHYEHIGFSLDDFGVGTIVPEPSMAVLLISGLLAAMVCVRRRRR